MAESKVRKSSSQTASDKGKRGSSRPAAPLIDTPPAIDLAHPSRDHNGAPGAAANPARATAHGPGTVEIPEKVKELVRLAQEQGYLTYGDINDTLPDHVIA